MISYQVGFNLQSYSSVFKFIIKITAYKANNALVIFTLALLAHLMWHIPHFSKYVYILLLKPYDIYINIKNQHYTHV